MARRRKVPQRTCIGCRQVGDKRTLLRIVRTPEGTICFDPTGKRSGRGAYVCRRQECLEDALRNRTLTKALKADVDDDTVRELRAELQQLLLEQEDTSATP